MNYKILQYEKIDISKGIDTNKTSASKECMLVANSMIIQFCA